jgi:hypothetical protein
MNFRRSLAILGCAALLGAAGPASASAILQLIDNEGHSAQVTGTAPTLSLSVNNSTGSFAGSPWSFAIAVGTTSTSAVGIPAIDFNLTATAARSGALTAIYSINGLSYGSGLTTVSVNSLVSSLFSNGVMWNVCVDDGNVLTAQTVCTGFGGMNNDVLSIPNVALNGLFSLTIVGRINESASSRLAVNAAAVPEPSVLLLFGLGLLALGVVRRRSWASV